MPPHEPDEACECGHLRDEHDTFRAYCQAIVIEHNTEFYCRCQRFTPREDQL